MKKWQRVFALFLKHFLEIPNISLSNARWTMDHTTQRVLSSIHVDVDVNVDVGNFRVKTQNLEG